MKELIFDIIKGALIGIANVIPGVSGGTIAVSTGIYEKLINAINNITKDFKQSFKTLWPIVLGMIIGIVALSFAITFLLERFTVPTTACFIGMVLGGVPMLHKKIQNEKLKWTHIVSFAFALLIIIIPALVALNTTSISNVELDFVNVFILFLLGLLSSTAMVVPGVSGSMILMMFGYYEFVISLIKQSVSNLVHFDIATLFFNMGFLVPFAIGVIVGILGISRFISQALKKWPNATTWVILGLVCASPFAIIIKMGTVTLSTLSIIASIITFGIGFLVSNKLGEKGE